MQWTNDYVSKCGLRKRLGSAHIEYSTSSFNGILRIFKQWMCFNLCKPWLQALHRVHQSLSFTPLSPSQVSPIIKAKEIFPPWAEFLHASRLTSGALKHSWRLCGVCCLNGGCGCASSLCLAQGGGLLSCREQSLMYFQAMAQDTLTLITWQWLHTVGFISSYNNQEWTQRNLSSSGAIMAASGGVLVEK